MIPGTYVNDERTVLVAIGPDGNATIAFRDSRLDTWSPPRPATTDEISLAPYTA